MAAPLAAQSSPALAEGAVRSSIYNAFPPAQRDSIASSESLAVMIASADPATKAKALAALKGQIRNFTGDPDAAAVIATGILDLGDVEYVRKSAENLYHANPESPSANMLMARVAQADGRLQDAIKFYKAVPGGDPLGPQARANLIAVRGDLERQGRPAAEALPSGARPVQAAVRTGPGGVPGSYNGLTRADLLLAAEMFRTKRSERLTATLKKAAQGDTADLAVMRSHGIDVARGPAAQSDPVAIAKNGGVVTLSFSPAVLDNPDKDRAFSLMANGFEQAATQRDFQGVSRWLREWGGRAVGVIVYSQLVVQNWMGTTSGVDRDLVSDRIAFESAGHDHFVPLPNRSQLRLFSAKKAAGENSIPIQHFLYYGGAMDRTIYNPNQMPDSDAPYHDQLQSYPAPPALDRK